jgi:hypothetical protein
MAIFRHLVAIVGEASRLRAEDGHLPGVSGIGARLMRSSLHGKWQHGGHHPSYNGS